MHLPVVLSGINNLKSVRFFKLVLRYNYSIVLYMFLACTMHVYVYASVLPFLCLNVIQEVIIHTDPVVLQ